MSLAGISSSGVYINRSARRLCNMGCYDAIYMNIGTVLVWLTAKPDTPTGDTKRMHMFEVKFLCRKSHERKIRFGATNYKNIPYLCRPYVTLYSYRMISVLFAKLFYEIRLRSPRSVLLFWMKPQANLKSLKHTHPPSLMHNAIIARVVMLCTKLKKLAGIGLLLDDKSLYG